MPIRSRVKLSLAVDLERQHGVEIDFRKLLEAKRDKTPHGERAYEGLAGIATTFITTNYDEWLDNWISKPPPSILDGDPSAASRLSRTSIYKPDEINLLALAKSNPVIHIHGSVKDRESMVLTYCA